MRNGGLNAMLYDLLQRDIEGWHPRKIIQTDALGRQQEQSLAPLDAWFLELLQTGALEGASDLAPYEAVSHHYEAVVEEEEEGGFYGRRKRKRPSAPASRL